MIKRMAIERELNKLPHGLTISSKPLSHICPLHFSRHFFISGDSTASAELIIFSIIFNVIYEP